MIWLFKIDEVFWDTKPKVNDYFLFDVEDSYFDITDYDISLYFGTAHYYILNEADGKIYYLRYVGNKNPDRILVENSETIQIIKEYYRDKKINQILK